MEIMIRWYHPYVVCVASLGALELQLRQALELHPTTLILISLSHNDFSHFQSNGGFVLISRSWHITVFSSPVSNDGSVRPPFLLLSHLSR